jgi:hypothetical protein
LVTLESGAPVGSRPTNAALVTTAGWPRTKSSAVSVSSLTPGGRESVAIFPSGLSVLNSVTGAAAAVV